MTAFLYMAGTLSPAWLVLAAYLVTRRAKPLLRAICMTAAVLMSLPIGVALVLDSVAPNDPNVQPTAANGIALVPFVVIWVAATVPTLSVLLIHICGMLNKNGGTRSEFRRGP